MLDTLIRIYRNIARRFKKTGYLSFAGLNGRIHSQDQMYAGDINHYKKVGESALENIEASLRAGNRSWDSMKAVLDMPSGHGRVIRVLATKVDPGIITACEIERGGIEFCASEFGTKKFLSSVNLSRIRFPEKYSLIWVGSLFTHLNEQDFTTLLRLLFEALEPDGILVFTTHGTHSMDIWESYWSEKALPMNKEELKKRVTQNNGFFYAPYPRSKGYGVSISLKEYVHSLISKLFGDRAVVLRYAERGWDKHQDVVTVQKRASF